MGERANPNTADLQAILARFWGYPNFRPYQREIIESVVAGHDTLALLATGGGKSITYQVAGLARGGLTIVVTPLIALMEDQVQGLKARGIRAEAVHSGLPSRTVALRLDNCINGRFSFLYVSPERLATAAFLGRLPDMDVRLIAVDEAHCISQWGYDFRPAYRQIATIREYLPGVPILAVTATATPPVASDIQEQLAFTNGQLFNAGFARPNLRYGVSFMANKMDFLVSLARHYDGSGIVYVRTRAQTIQIQNALTDRGVTARAYHAGMEHSEREAAQQGWMQGQYRVMVATNAFGMGIDKPDTRFVLHLGFPASLEEYYQEAGRAGRDGLPAHAVIACDEHDIIRARAHFKARFPNLQLVHRFYRALLSYFAISEGEGLGSIYDFPLQDFAKRYRYSEFEALQYIDFLERMGVLEMLRPKRTAVLVQVVADPATLQAYRDSSQNFDALFQLLLGTFPEISRREVEVPFEKVSRTLRKQPKELLRLMQAADQSGLLSLRLFREARRIVFDTACPAGQQLPIEMEMVKTAYIRERERLEAMLGYVLGHDACRDVTLRAYFGETGLSRCGHCDSCLSRAQQPSSSQTDLRKRVIASLGGAPRSTRYLLESLHVEPKPLQEALQNLIAQGIVLLRSDGRFSLL